MDKTKKSLTQIISWESDQVIKNWVNKSKCQKFSHEKALLKKFDIETLC